MNRVHQQREDATSASRHSSHFHDEIVDLTRSFDVSLQPIYHSSGNYPTSSTRRDDTSPSDNYYSQSLRSGFKELRQNYNHGSVDDPHSNPNKYRHQYDRYLQADHSLRGGSHKHLELYRSNSSLELDSSDKQQGIRRRGVGVGAEDSYSKAHQNSPQPPNKLSLNPRKNHLQRTHLCQHPEVVVSSHKEYGSANSLDTKIEDEIDSASSPDAPPTSRSVNQRNPASNCSSSSTSGSATTSCGVNKKSSNNAPVKKATSEDISSSIMKKLRSNTTESRHRSFTDSMDNSLCPSIDIDSCRQRKAFTHFDCQSISVQLNNVIARRLNAQDLAVGVSSNTAASSACDSDSSQLDSPVDTEPLPPKGNAHVHSSLQSKKDDGAQANDLLKKCPHFREETGIEIRTQISAHLRQSNRDSSMQSVIPSICNAVTILDTSRPYNATYSSSQSVTSAQAVTTLQRGLLLEYVDTGATYYSNYFKHQEHQNYLGIDDRLGPVVISICREPRPGHTPSDQSVPASVDVAINKSIPPPPHPPEKVSYQYRVIVRTSELTTIRGTVVEEAVPSCSQNQRKPRDVIEYIAPEVNISTLRTSNSTPKVHDAIASIDEQSLIRSYKIGVLHCLEGQCTEEDMYNNEHMTPSFEEFLSIFSDKIDLKDFKGYRGGLDCKSDSTGKQSRFASFKDYEIMFHVAPMLPFTANNTQQLLRKRHIGNDMVTLIFQEAGAKPFSPKTIRSQFQHVFIVVRVHNQNSSNVKYSVAVTRSKGVPSFGPLLSPGKLYERSEEFKYFLLTKIINAENAVYKSDKFVHMAQRTRGDYMKDLILTHSTTTSLESTSKFGKFSLGSGRKKEKHKNCKQSVDIKSKCAIVWNVQIDDHCEFNKRDGYLAIAPRCLVLVDASTQLTLFAVGCRNIIGWTRTNCGIRIFYNDGECISFTMYSGGNGAVSFEIMEIISRLEVLTNGCETAEMTLKRNSSGSFGFQLGSHGIVYDVDTYNSAWENGIRKCSRIVDMCGVVTAILSDAQISEFLNTCSNVITVTAIAAHDDATARTGLDAVWKSPRHSNSLPLPARGKFKKTSSDSSGSTTTNPAPTASPTVAPTATARPTTTTRHNKKHSAMNSTPKQSCQDAKYGEGDHVTSSAAPSRYTVYPAYKQKHNTPSKNSYHYDSGPISHIAHDSSLPPQKSVDLPKKKVHRNIKDTSSNRHLSYMTEPKNTTKFQTNLMKLIDPRILMNLDKDDNQRHHDVRIQRCASEEQVDHCSDGNNTPKDCSPIHSRHTSTAHTLNNNAASVNNPNSESNTTIEKLQNKIAKLTEVCNRERTARISLQRQLAELRSDYECQQIELAHLQHAAQANGGTALTGPAPSCHAPSSSSTCPAHQDLAELKLSHAGLKAENETLVSNLSQLGEWFFDHASDPQS